MRTCAALIIVLLLVLAAFAPALWDTNQSAPVRETAPADTLTEAARPIDSDPSAASQEIPSASVERSGTPAQPLSTASSVEDQATAPQPVLWASGSVSDLEGKPLAGAVITFPTGHVLCDSQGRFEIRAPLLKAGTHGIHAIAGGYLVSTQQVMLPTQEELRFQLAPARTIEGFVLDAGGAPIGGVRIYADASTMPRFADSDAEGRFVLADPIGDQDATYLHVLQGATEAWRSPEKVTWGSTNHLLTLVPTVGVEIEVVDRTNGAPIEQYAVHCLAPNQRPSASSLSFGGPHADGKLLINAVPKGERMLWVVPEGRRFAPHERQPIFVKDGTPVTVRIELETRPRVEIEVHDATGAPIPDATVELIRSPWKRDLRLMDVVRSDESGLLRSGEAFGALLDQQTSDEAGHAALNTVPDRPQLTLPRTGLPPEVRPALFVRVSAQGYAPQLHPAPFAAAVGAPLRLVLQRGATLIGQIVPPEILAHKPILWLAPAGYDAGLATALPPFARPFECDATGTVVMNDSAAGAYDLRVFFEHIQCDDFVLRTTLRSAETERIVVDLGRMLPGLVDIVVEGVSEAYWLHFEATVTNQRSTIHVKRASQLLDASGAIHELSVYPGPYDIVLLPKQIPSMGSSLRPIWLGAETVNPGERHSFRFAFPSRTLKLRFRFADGSIPPAGTEVAVMEASVSYAIKTDELGACVLKPAPHSKFQLMTRRTQYPREGMYEPPAGQADWELDIELRR